MVSGFKKIMSGLLLTVFSVALTCLLLEVALRFMPVNEVLRSQAVSDSYPVLTFAPNRTMTWSKFPEMAMVNTVHSNNYGFINDQDYSNEGSPPVVGVIGDSFIEALMVPYENTLQGRLSNALADSARVYSFARSGAPLSQYLGFAAWARQEFSPRKLVIVVVGNDFHESLSWYKSSPGFHFFHEQDGKLVLRRNDYEPGIAIRVIDHSKLLLYVLNNLKAHTLPERLKALLLQGGEKAAFTHNTAHQASGKMLRDSKRGVDAFLEQLPVTAGLNAKDICLVVDGVRFGMFTDEGLEHHRSSYAGMMFRYTVDQARRRGFRVVDMDPFFIGDHARNGEPFQYERDGHWNDYAHGIAAKAVMKSGFFDDL